MPGAALTTGFPMDGEHFEEGGGGWEKSCKFLLQGDFAWLIFALRFVCLGDGASSRKRLKSRIGGIKAENAGKVSLRERRGT